MELAAILSWNVEVTHILIQFAVKSTNNDPAQECGFLQHPEIGLPVPRTELPSNLKKAKKIPKNKGSMKNLDGLYDALASILSVIKPVIMEPVKREITIRISFGKKARAGKFGKTSRTANQTKALSGSSAYNTIRKNNRGANKKDAKDARSKIEGGEKLKSRRITDGSTWISSIH